MDMLPNVKNDNANSQKEEIITRMALNDNKAGMSGLDKEKINKMIMESTVGSRYYKNEQKRDAQVKDRIAKMKNRFKLFTSEEKEAALHKADAIILDAEKNRDLTRTLIHIDMDAFYASVEERDQPELKTKPMAVGGMDMLSTSNYVARKFGVRAAMPGFIAMKLCPDLIIVPLNFEKYKQASKEIQEIYSEYDKDFMAASLDEAYLDITDHLEHRILMSEQQRTFQCRPDLPEADAAVSSTDGNNDAMQRDSITFGFSPEDVAKEIRFRIRQKTKLTASAGIGPNLMLSKIGSDFNKPNGQTYIPSARDYIVEFMKELSIRKVSGIGKVSEQLLSALQIKKCGDLYTHRSTLVLLFSNISSSFFLRTSVGVSSNKVVNESDRKSISTERTFHSTSNTDELYSKLLELCKSLSEDALHHNIQGKTVTLKTKTINFELHTRSKTSNRFLSSADDIFVVSKDLLRHEIVQSNSNLSLRLIGVGLSNLEPLSNANQSSIKKFFTKTTASPSSSKPLDTGIKSHSSDEASNKVEATNKESFTENLPTKNEENNAAFQLSMITAATSHADADTTDLEASASCSSIVTDDRFTCPVCGEDKFSGLLSLNQHLDACVTSSPPTKKFVSAITEESKETELSCPICGMSFDSSTTSLEYLNTHVDSCLNRKAIKDILKSDLPMTKLRSSQVSNKQPKRRKLNKNQSHTIDKFFS